MDIKNISIIALIAASLGAVNADAKAMDNCSKQQEGIPGNSARSLRQHQNLLIPPGIYISKPYLSIVIVPESIDPMLVTVHEDVDPGFEQNFGAGKWVNPPGTYLEPYKPDR
jgi:hypothetical protein